MRLFTKIFLCGTFVFTLAFLVSGYVLIRYSWNTGVEREQEFALRQYQYDKFTVQSALLANAQAWGQLWGVGEHAAADSGISQTEQGRAAQLEQLFANVTETLSVPCAFFSEEGVLLYSQIEGMDGAVFAELVRGQAQVLEEGRGIYHNGYEFREMQGRPAILTYGLLSFGSEEAQQRLFFVTQSDIGELITQQQTLTGYFKRCYAAGMAVGMVLLLALSAFLTRPLKRMTKAADRMASGDYEERLAISGSDEIGELAHSLNRMAQAVEEKVEELSEAARQKEDFVANFAHELKTPLTSVIGYADMLYQKELSRKEAKQASWYIWNEGMRLEALSLKLMDLIVLNRQQFSLQEMPADELLQDAADSLRPVLEKWKSMLTLEAEQAYIRVDYDLFKTLLLNLVDNSLKAGASRITLCGKFADSQWENRDSQQNDESFLAEGNHFSIRGEGNTCYRIYVRDNGRGIPQEELSRITEAFYMVDKSRARKQHGAGLGLALAERIAKVHQGRLEFASQEGKGTTVCFSLPCEKGDCNEEVAD